MLDIVGLKGFEDRSATLVSGGRQQRIALARALVAEPRLVLFDEALSNLDAQLREQMRLELRLLQERLGFAAIYVTHDQAEACGLADTVVLMNHGKIEMMGSARAVFRRPASPFVARFLGLNLLEGTVRAAVAGTPYIDVAQAPPAVLAAPETNAELTAAFRKPYGMPESFAVKYTLSATLNLVTRVDQEVGAGNVTIDVASLASPPWINGLISGGHIMQYDSPEHAACAKAFAAGIGKQGYYAFNGAYMFVPAWNADNFQFKGKSWKDVLGAIGNGRMSLNDAPNKCRNGWSPVRICRHSAMSPAASINTIFAAPT